MSDTVMVIDSFPPVVEGESKIKAKPTKSPAKFGEKDFVAVAKRYAGSALTDAVIRIIDRGGDPQVALDNALEAIKALEYMAETGSSFTPPVAQGFGSSNAAVIALSVLGRNKTRGAVRSLLAKIGRMA